MKLQNVKTELIRAPEEREEEDDENLWYSDLIMFMVNAASKGITRKKMRTANRIADKCEKKTKTLTFDSKESSFILGLIEGHKWPMRHKVLEKFMDDLEKADKTT
jgi:hypothetical protein